LEGIKKQTVDGQCIPNLLATTHCVGNFADKRFGRRFEYYSIS